MISQTTILFDKIITYIYLRRTIGNVSTRHQHGYGIPIQQDLIQFRNASSFRSVFVFGHVLQQHIHKVIEAEQRPDDFLVVPEDDVNARSNAFVDQFCVAKMGGKLLI